MFQVLRKQTQKIQSHKLEEFPIWEVTQRTNNYHPLWQTLW